MLYKLIVDYNNFSMEITEFYDKVVELGKRHCNKAEVKKVTIIDLSNQSIVAVGGQGILKNISTNEIL